MSDTTVPETASIASTGTKMPPKNVWGPYYDALAKDAIVHKDAARVNAEISKPERAPLKNPSDDIMNLAVGKIRTALLELGPEFGLRRADYKPWAYGYFMPINSRDSDPDRRGRDCHRLVGFLESNDNVDLQKSILGLIPYRDPPAFENPELLKSWKCSLKQKHHRPFEDWFYELKACPERDERLRNKKGGGILKKQTDPITVEESYSEGKVVEAQEIIDMIDILTDRYGSATTDKERARIKFMIVAALCLLAGRRAKELYRSKYTIEDSALPFHLRWKLAKGDQVRDVPILYWGDMANIKKAIQFIRTITPDKKTSPATRQHGQGLSDFFAPYRKMRQHSHYRGLYALLANNNRAKLGYCNREDISRTLAKVLGHKENTSFLSYVGVKILPDDDEYFKKRAAAPAEDPSSGPEDADDSDDEIDTRAGTGVDDEGSAAEGLVAMRAGKRQRTE